MTSRGGRSEKVGKLKVFVAQAVAAKMADKVLAGIIGHDALIALSAEKLDVVEDVFERVICLAQRTEGLVEDAAIGFGGVVEFVLEISPAGALWDEEAVVVVGVLAIYLLCLVERHPLLDFAPDDLLILGVEDIRAALQEEHPKDVIFVGSGIEALLPQAVVPVPYRFVSSLR
jgi:hypothetical protein